MAQEYYKMNGKKIAQPDKDLGFNWETTYTEDSGRSKDGTATVKPLLQLSSMSIISVIRLLNRLHKYFK